MSIRTAPCDWPVLYASCPTPENLPAALAELPEEKVEIFERMAATYLWNWTGRSLGVCEVTIYPCRQDCSSDMSTFNGSGPGPYGFNTPWTPVIIEGNWFNVGCGRCGSSCGCGGEAPLKIPGPIDSVTEIKEDGVILDPSSYRVENHALLVRTDGGAWSPCGLEITYKRGTAVPEGGQVAAGVLTVELAKAACGDKTCQLPQRVQTVTRQGITIAMLDAFDDIDKGHTGIWIIDSWIASLTKSPQSARVLSPDVPRHSPRRRTS